VNRDRDLAALAAEAQNSRERTRRILRRERYQRREVIWQSEAKSPYTGKPIASIVRLVRK
jgi:hypothetical protein